MDKTKPVTVEAYITQFPPNVQDILKHIRAVIKEAAPNAVEKISYRMPGFSLNGNLVWFAAYPHHIGFYPEPSAIEAFKDEISHYKWSKGAVQFPLDQPIPYDLIRRMVLFRVAQNQAKAS
ncbi:MAG TPA: hypothetical protein DCK95_08230 [Anaerolineaceae bacterium]|nr:hypothetical protein [Anaerolineaceae bacterium]